MNLYVLGGIALAIALAFAGEETRLLIARHQLSDAREATVHCRQEFLDYEQAAAAEAVKQLAYTRKIEAQQQAEVEHARIDYAQRLAAVNARWLRNDAEATTRISVRAVSDSAELPERGVDAAAPSDGLPRCVAQDRGPQFAALLEAAEVNAVQLLECQRAVRALSGG